MTDDHSEAGDITCLMNLSIYTAHKQTQFCVQPAWSMNTRLLTLQLFSSLFDVSTPCHHANLRSHRRRFNCVRSPRLGNAPTRHLSARPSTHDNHIYLNSINIIQEQWNTPNLESPNETPDQRRRRLVRRFLDLGPEGREVS